MKIEVDKSLKLDKFCTKNKPKHKSQKVGRKNKKKSTHNSQGSVSRVWLADLFYKDLSI
jgi:hypothetical protein